MPFITRYCCIRNFTCVVQGDTIFEQNAEVDYDKFLDNSLKTLAISYPKFYKMDRLSKSGVLAAELLLDGRKMASQYLPQQVAIVLSNGHASLDTDIRYFETSKTIASPALFVYTLANIVTGEICIRHGLKGENAFFVSEVFDPARLCQYVNLVMALPQTQACIAGWIEVLGDRHDVFLYLVEKRQNASSVDHKEEEINKLYYSKYGTVDGRS